MNKNNYYFTFGSDECFPFCRGYIIVKADTLEAAIEKFRKEYPDKRENVVNCAFWYTQEEWDKNQGVNGFEKLHRIIE